MTQVLESPTVVCQEGVSSFGIGQCELRTPCSMGRAIRIAASPRLRPKLSFLGTSCSRTEHAFATTTCFNTLAAILYIKVQLFLRFCNHDAPLSLRLSFSIILQQSRLDVLPYQEIGDLTQRPDSLFHWSISAGFDPVKALTTLFLCFSCKHINSDHLCGLSMTTALPPSRMSYRDSYHLDARGRAGPVRDQYQPTTVPGSVSSSRRLDTSLASSSRAIPSGY